ncbi:MAG TPA: nucleoside-diphosphate kinase [Candidatus Dormibacteraeota bacterium]|nr:nucleoside-diphosphate kinase [Candidatus Dormibacteraeota bacterium]
MERTLIVFKPDAVQRGIVGEVLSRFEKVGLKIAGLKMLSPDRDYYYHHYEDIGKLISRRGKDTFEITLDMMMEGPVVAAVLEGIEAVSLVRKMVGPTEPKDAPPGTIRGDYAHMSYKHGDAEQIGIPNILHASGDEKEAEAEIAHWFSQSELYDYESVHQKFTQAKKKK